MIGIPTGKFKDINPMESKKYINRPFNAVLAGIISLLLINMSSCRMLDELDQYLMEVEADQEAVEEEEWIIPRGFRQSLRTLKWDLQHQKLWVRFDFNSEQVLGQTELFFINEDDSTRQVVLDSRNIDFERIALAGSEDNLRYLKGSSTVTVILPEYYHEGDSLYLDIEYTATPRDRGLYFVDPQGKDPSLPTQVWTLGQPEDNSYWFPTVDHPGERRTQEMWISVPDSLETLSNGALIESRVMPGDSLRTDYWKLDQPHAPYLTALAAGNFNIEERLHDDIVMRYYTEPQYARYVDDIYEDTEEMFDFIHDHINIRYPWDGVYSQAPVHNYIADGMENTTATFLHDGIQMDERAKQHRTNEDLLMHHITNHWFGNLVTAKNWANLPLNGGFANYFEILFREHSEGEEEAIWKNLENRELYFTEAQEMRRPVIFNRYHEPEDMYDSHTYQKTGQILRMLHHYVEDETWWEALNTYLERHQFDAVDVGDLQDAFEEVSGESLEWFFDQWFHQPGHPRLELDTRNTATGKELQVRQTQDRRRQPLFRLEAEIEFIKSDAENERKTITVDQEDSTYSFDDPRIDQIVFDPDRVQLAEYFTYIDEDDLIDRLDHSNVAVRAEALDMLYGLRWSTDMERKLRSMVTEDEFAGIRKRAIQVLADLGRLDPVSLATGLTYENEKDSRVREHAFWLLENHTTARVQNFAEEMTRDTSYSVAAEAIAFYGRTFPEDVHEIAPKFIESYSYQNMLREAAVEALSNSTHEEAYQALKNAAQHHGEHDYILYALAYLPEFADELDVEDELAEFFVEKARTSPYSSVRAESYEGLGAIGASGKLEFLREQYQKADSEFEREVLEYVIEELEAAV